MRKIALLAGCALLALASPSAFGSTVVLSDLALNDNGVFTDNITPGSHPGSLTFALDSSGLGTLTYTLNPGVAGAYFMAMYFDYDVSAPFWNEYGAFSGTHAAGQTWQIDAANNVGDANFPSATLFSNVENNTMDHTNHVGGQTDNFFFDCGANGGGAVNTACNTDVAMGMGFNYTLTSTEEATVTFDINQTGCPPGALCLETIHPIDAGNVSAQTVFLSSTLQISEVGPKTPEPASWLLVGSAALIGFGAFRRKFRGK